MEIETKGRASSAIAERWTRVEGHRVRYLFGGCGPPLVLLHGLLGYSFSWRYTLPALAERSTVCAVDMLGAGFSDRPANLDCCFRGQAKRLLGFLDGIGIVSCDLLATSHGGAVAMMMAAMAPERVRSLILVAPVNPWSAHGRRWAPFLSSAVRSALIRFFGRRLEATHGLALRRLYGDRKRIRRGTLEGYSAALRIPGTFEYGLSVLRSWNRDLRELEAVLPRIAGIPTLLLWGSKDATVNPASAQPLGHQFKDCRIEMFQGVGHLPYEEVPEEFNSSVLGFLSGICREVS